MERKKVDPAVKQPAAEIADTVSLGKRHVYNGAKPEKMDQIARRIGFSSDEISELKRIYASELTAARR